MWDSAFTVEDEPQPVETSNRGDEQVQENADYWQLVADGENVHLY